MHPGLVAGIAGAVIGVMGGVIGCCAGIMNTTKPRERALMIRLSGLMALWTIVLFAWMFLAPEPWMRGAVLLGVPLWLAIPWINRRAARARALDQAEASAGGTASCS